MAAARGSRRKSGTTRSCRERQRPVGLLGRQEMPGRVPGIPQLISNQPAARRLERLLLRPGPWTAARPVAPAAPDGGTGSCSASSSSATTNRLAASKPRSSAAASSRTGDALRTPPAVSSLRTDASSMNGAMSGACRSRTSETKYSAIVVTADIERPGPPSLVLGAAQRQRRHLQGRRPPLGSPMKQGQVSSVDTAPVPRQQGVALGRVAQVMVAKLAHSPDIRSRCSRTCGSKRLDRTS